MQGPPVTIATQLAEAPCLLIMLDYDGTLSPIVSRPRDAFLPDGAMALLERLSCLPGTTVAVISGRALADLGDRIPCKDIILFGNHGLECRGISPMPIDIEGFVHRMDVLSERLERSLAPYPDVEVENKGPVISVHYRLAPEKEHDSIRGTVIAAAVGEDDVRLVEGKKVLEIRPDVSVDKGTAVLRLIAEMEGKCGRPPLSLYAGDDTTDEDAFARVGDGVTILVGEERVTKAEYVLEGPNDLIRFLGGVADARSSRFETVVDVPFKERTVRDAERLGRPGPDGQS